MNAQASSMMPVASVAISPACHAIGERLRRQHHEEHVGEERHGVDAVGQRADVLTAGPRRKRASLERIGDVADEDRDRGSRQHPPVNELRREAEHGPAQRVDQEQLDEIVYGKAEESVDVAADDPTHTAEISAFARRLESHL
jgi:hypothetical protein